MSSGDTIFFVDQAVIVTGAGQGLGAVYALELGRRGAKVVVNDLPGNAGAEEIALRIRQEGGEAIVSCHSVASPEGGEEVVEDTLRQFGRVDALVNNAGVMGAGVFEELSDQAVQATLDVNLAGAFNIGRPAYREMRKSGRGRIVNISSGSIFGFAGAAPYAASKAGIIGLTKSWAIEAQSHGIKVNALLPASASPMTSDALHGPTRIPGFAEDEEWNAAFSAMASRYIPESAAAMVTFLASTECPFTGEILTAVSGRYARVFLGVGRGWAAPADEMNAEGIRDNLSTVLDSTNFSIHARSREYFIETSKLVKDL